MKRFNKREGIQDQGTLPICRAKWKQDGNRKDKHKRSIQEIKQSINRSFRNIDHWKQSEGNYQRTDTRKFPKAEEQKFRIHVKQNRLKKQTNPYGYRYIFYKVSEHQGCLKVWGRAVDWEWDWPSSFTSNIEF